MHLCSIFIGLRCRSAADCESWRWTSPAAQVDDVNDPMKCKKVQKDQVCKRRRCELFSAHDETKPFGEDKSGGWNYVSGTKECFTAVYGQAGGCFIPDMKYTETGGNSSPKSPTSRENLVLQKVSEKKLSNYHSEQPQKAHLYFEVFEGPFRYFVVLRGTSMYF